MDEHFVKHQCVLLEFSRLYGVRYVRKSARTVPSYPWEKHDYEINTPKFMIVLVIVAALVLGGGTAVMAEGAVPGDALYAVKTSINESVYAAAAVSDEAQARWEGRAAERRMEEAAELSARGELSAEVAADLSAEFESHAEAALKNASALAAEGKVEAATGIAAVIDGTLKAHADLLKSARVFVGGNTNASGSSNVETSSDEGSSASVKQETSIQSDLKADISL
ncbi:hypothetical protein HY969_04065 [Candidatus Kaiserbacteria bacterium]|nr:hypothetical protein [Candidatus Kaiserbacteria bacterium]